MCMVTNKKLNVFQYHQPALGTSYCRRLKNQSEKVRKNTEKVINRNKNTCAWSQNENGKCINITSQPLVHPPVCDSKTRKK